MPRGKTLIRVRSHQEQKRRRLLMLGIPLLAIGSALIWYVGHYNNTPLENQAPAAPIAASNPTTEPLLTAQRLDSPPPEPQEEPNATVATPAPSTPVALNTPTTPTPNNSTPNNTSPNNTSSAAPALTASSQNDVPAPKAETTSLSEPLATLNQTEQNQNSVEKNTSGPTPVEALPGSTLAQNIPTPPASEPVTNTTTTGTTTASASTPTSTPNPPVEVSLVNEPVSTPPSAAAPTVVINASTRNENSTASSKVSSTTLLALSGGIPLSTPRTLPTPAATPSSPNLNPTTRQEGNVVTNPTTPTTQGNGWIYAGQFSNGTWLQRGLVIGDQLPAQGQRYQLATGAKVRTAPPGRRTGTNNLGETIGFINPGQSIQVVQVKNSGNSGHIWLQVTR